TPVATADRRTPCRTVGAASRAGSRTPPAARRRRVALARRAPAGSRRARCAASRGSARRPASRRSPRSRLPSRAPTMLGVAAMRLGLITPIVTRHPANDAAWTEDAGPAELARIAAAADRLGFHHLTCSEHVAIPASAAATRGTRYYDPLATFGF